MRRWYAVSLSTLALLVAGCPVLNPEGTVILRFDFAGGDNGWQADWSDYPADAEDSLQLEAGIRDLPDEIAPDATGFYIQGLNSPDDLFMYLSRELGPADGIVAGQTYRVRYTIVVASNAPSGCAGVGGAPGESVYLKAGAADVAPVAAPDSEDYVQLNLDKGNQAEGGDDASVIGHIANGITCPDEGAAEVPYVSLVRTHIHTSHVTASAEGRLWLIVGTDSGYESVTALYYQEINVTLRPVAGE